MPYARLGRRVGPLFPRTHGFDPIFFPREQLFHVSYVNLFRVGYLWVVRLRHRSKVKKKGRFMKRVVLATLIVLLLIPSISSARGWRRHRGGGVAVGFVGGFTTGIVLDRLFLPPYPERVYYGPWRYPYYLYPTPSYAPPAVVAAPAPQLYQPSQQQYWYWCEDSQGYYPYIQSCPSNWKQVIPQTYPPGR